MSMSGRRFILPSFAAFLEREDVYFKIKENAQKVLPASNSDRYSKLTRLFDNIPQHHAIIPLLIACESAIVNGEKPNQLSFEGSLDGSITDPTLSDECNTWLDYIFASAIFELFDAKGDLRNDIKNYFAEFKLGFSDEELKKGLFAAYMEDIVGSHVAALAGSRTKEGCEQLLTDQVFLCSTAIQTKLQKLLQPDNIDFNVILKQLNQCLRSKYKQDAINSAFLKDEVRKIMYSSLYQLAWTDFYAARTHYAAVHLSEITPVEQEAKQKVVEEVNNIIQSLNGDAVKTQVEKLSILTQVLVQTEAYTPKADEKTRNNYSQLIAKVSEHAWGKRLAGAMSAVPVAALVATCVLFSIATGGAAIPFLAGIGFAALLGISIVCGVGAVAALSASIYTLWHGFKNKPIADAMKEIRDKSSIKKAPIGAFLSKALR